MTDRDVAHFAAALLACRGIGRRTTIEILRRYDGPDALVSATLADLEAQLGRRSARALHDALDGGWQVAWDAAERLLVKHEDRGISVVAFAAAGYPRALSLAPDPAALLYVRGDVGVLDRLAVAIVGTREPTSRGAEIAHRVARRFAGAGCVVVSGLALGIDTAAHTGALEEGQTVAVIGTAIDKTYAASNKRLAERIVESGAIVSEYPIGHRAEPTSFVERDRIQAWLSVGVVPVQTGRTGGTQHTIKFARAAGRRLLCPRPVASERGAPQNEGIIALLESGEATEFVGDDIARIVEELRDARDRLAGSGNDARPVVLGEAELARSGPPVPAVDRLAELARYRATFAEPGFSIGRWSGGERGPDGVIQMPWFEYSEAAQAFVADMYAQELVVGFAWSEWASSPQGRRLLEDRSQIAEASADDLAKLLTVIIRGDRFSEGNIAGAYESGFLGAILDRAAVLASSPPDPEP